MEKKLIDGARILVVDDEMGMREGCRRVLAPLGSEVDLAPDLATARKLAAETDYDLFLLDVMLPDGSGLDLIAPILEHDADAICIIVTGYSSVEMAVEAVRRGAYNFLSKPFTSDELQMAVAQGLERRRLKFVERQAEDLTQAKAELERLDQVKSELMLKVAHELRAPAAAAQSYVNLISAGYVSGDELKSTLNRVRARLQEMLELIAHLLDLARLKELHGLPESASDQDMAGILKEVYDMLADQAREKGQSFQLEILDHPTIYAQHEHMKQIWTNLISNAIKYTPKGGRIAVRLEADDELLIGVVEDSGIGMSQQEMTHLFEEFFRSDAAKATGEIGTGLGLSIVKQIVDSYGGEIKVTSAPGKGSRFRFFLPLKPAPVPAVQGSAAGKQDTESDKSQPAKWGTHTRAFIFGQERKPRAH